MSLLSKWSCYPRVSPITNNFWLGVDIHTLASPGHLEMAKTAGFDHVLFDNPQEYASPSLTEITNGCAKAGLQALILQSTDPEYIKLVDATVLCHLTINEPNSRRFWTAGAEALVVEYRKLRENAKQPIIGGNLVSNSGANPEQWVKDLWKYGADECLDFIGIHVYDDAGRPALKQYEWMLKMYRKAGFRQPVWCSEFGFPSRGFGNSPEKQARWLTYVLSRLSRKLDCAGAVVYELYNDTHWSLIDFKTGAPLPALGRIQEASK